jgi:hypothetical protein
MAQPSVSDLAYRTLAGVVGGPVDLTTMVMRPFGYKTPDENVIGGSEWIGKQMERAGLVGSARAPIQEFLASLTVPTPSGVGKGLAMGAPALAGIFVGKGSRTWDALNAQKAKDLEKAGVDPKTIWQETGTWKGPDGKWRQEIDDSAARANMSAFEDVKANPNWNPLGDTKPLSSVVEHRNLQASYPDTSEIKTHFLPKDRMRGASGAYSTKHDRLTFSQDLPSEQKARSMALHEIQHAIQQRERFAQGGSPENAWIAAADFEEQAAKRLEDMRNFFWSKEGRAMTSAQKEAYKKRMAAISDAAKRYAADSNAAYRSLAGEAEARAVQARMNMSPAQRRATFPPASYDVDIDSLIMRGLE